MNKEAIWKVLLNFQFSHDWHDGQSGRSENFGYELKTLDSLSLKFKIDNKLDIRELETSPKAALPLEKIQKFRQKVLLTTRTPFQPDNAVNSTSLDRTAQSL